MKRAVLVMAKNHGPALLDPAMLEDSRRQALIPGFQIPAVNAYSTACDWFRFAEAYRRGGEIDGARTRPAIPANRGPSFYVRGSGVTSHAFGQLSSADTFGRIGTDF